MLAELVAAKKGHERYVDIWEYLSSQVPNERLNEIIDALFDQHIALRPADARMPALMSCWRQRNKRHDKQIVGPSHLLALIRRALPVTLPLANDLYYFWASVRYGPFTADDRVEVRRGMVAAARECLVDPARLVAAVDVPDMEEAHRWSLRHLIDPADQDESPSELRQLAEWQWLAPVLLEAAKENPTLILGETARIVGKLRQHMHVNTGPSEAYELQLDRVKNIFGSRTEELLNHLATANAGDDWILVEARKQCATALDMLPTSASEATSAVLPSGSANSSSDNAEKPT